MIDKKKEVVVEIMSKNIGMMIFIIVCCLSFIGYELQCINETLINIINKI